MGIQETLREISDKLVGTLEVTGGSISVPEAITIMKIFNYRERDIRPAFWLAARSHDVTVDEKHLMRHNHPRVYKK